MLAGSPAGTSRSSKLVIFSNILAGGHSTEYAILPQTTAPGSQRFQSRHWSRDSELFLIACSDVFYLCLGSMPESKSIVDFNNIGVCRYQVFHQFFSFWIDFGPARPHVMCVCFAPDYFLLIIFCLQLIFWTTEMHISIPSCVSK